MAPFRKIFLAVLLLNVALTKCYCEEENSAEELTSSSEEDLQYCDINSGKCGESSAEEDTENLKHEKSKYTEPKKSSGLSKETVKILLESLDAKLNKYESEMMSAYLMQEDENIGIKDINFKSRPEHIVHTVMTTFDLFDTNDDGEISKEEMEQYVQKLDTTSEKDEILQQFPEEPLNIHAFVQIISKFGGFIGIALNPIENNLDAYPSEQGKKIIRGFAKRFISLDLDEDGALTEEEFKSGIVHPDMDGQLITEERKQYFFTVMDVDKSNDITFGEFSAIMPPKPSGVKSVEDLFAISDKDDDGYLNKEEFRAHMEEEANRMKLPLPTDQQVDDGFDKLDQDGDDLLSPEELENAMKEYQGQNMLNAAEKAFESFDKNQDGVLNMGEVEAMVEMISKRANQDIDPNVLHEMLDTNKNGQVEPDELKALLKKVAAFTQKS